MKYVAAYKPRHHLAQKPTSNTSGSNAPNSLLPATRSSSRRHGNISRAN